MNKEGIKVNDGKGNEITMDSQGLICKDKNDNSITMDSGGLTCKDKNDNSITMNSSSVTIKSSKQIKIGEGASQEKLVLGTTFESLLTQWHILIATHTHSNGNLGALTGPPTPPLTPLPQLKNALSLHHVVE